MVNFLLLLENVIEYDKKTIDRGLTPQEVYELCSCIRETFCISYSIRKDNNLYIYLQNFHNLISFIGKELRFLGPDERSQALLLYKALKIARENQYLTEKRITESTPGIYVTKFLNDLDFIGYMKSKIRGFYYNLIDREKPIKDQLVRPNLVDKLEEINNSNLYILAPHLENLNFSDLIKEMKNIKVLSLSKIKSIENKILYINYSKDRQCEKGSL